jgi:hypothetical protein
MQHEFDAGDAQRVGADILVADRSKIQEYGSHISAAMEDKRTLTGLH